MSKRYSIQLKFTLHGIPLQAIQDFLDLHRLAASLTQANQPTSFSQSKENSP